MILSLDKFRKARGIAQSMERRIRKLRAANICPSANEILPMAELNTLLDELVAEYEFEHDRENSRTEDLTEEDLALIYGDA